MISWLRCLPSAVSSYGTSGLKYTTHKAACPLVWFWYWTYIRLVMHYCCVTNSLFRFAAVFSVPLGKTHSRHRYAHIIAAISTSSLAIIVQIHTVPTPSLICQCHEHWINFVSRCSAYKVIKLHLCDNGMTRTLWKSDVIFNNNWWIC